MDEFRGPSDSQFLGLPVFLSDTAIDGLIRWRMSLHDVVYILEGGVDSNNAARTSDTVERCATFRKRWMKVVAVRSFHYDTREECWLIIHIDETGHP